MLIDGEYFSKFSLKYGTYKKRGSTMFLFFCQEVLIMLFFVLEINLFALNFKSCLS